MQGIDVESFEQMRALDLERVRSFLVHGRPEQRVWAIWTLALARGPGDVLQHVAGEPDAGVRRTLAVLLASHGETDLLVGLARHDPSMVVRESAIQLVTRLVAGGGIDRAVIADAWREGPAMRIAILGAIGTDAPDFLVALATSAIEGPSFDTAEDEVQAEAFETLLRIATPATRDRARAWFRSRPNPADHVERWLRGADLAALAEAIADLAMPIRGAVIARLLDRLPTLPWPITAQLVGEDLELLRLVLRRPDIPIPARVLGATVMRGAHRGFAERLATQLAIAGRGRELAAELRRVIDDGPPEPSALDGIAGRVRLFANALEIENRDELLREIADHHPVERLLALDNAVGRWLATIDVADLVPDLPALRDYVEVQLARIFRRPPPAQIQFFPAGRIDPPFTNEREVFEALAAAILRLTPTAS